MIALALLAAACSSGENNEGGPDQADQDQAENGNGGSEATTDTDAESELEALELVVRPGPFQLAVDERPSGVSEAAVVEVTDADRAEPIVGRLAENGTALIRGLAPGEATVRVVDGDTRYRAMTVEIPGEKLDETAFYADTELSAGFNYITARDGTTLSAFVSLPGSANDGPYPTLVEYSGYSPSNPDAGEDPYRLLVPALGYALVQVNVRGTGCSGGSFDAFERIQSLDGYDVIETVAAQPWSAKVGMFGVSYPGIMQLHVASTKPPSLAAITPLSVTDGVQSVLYPGGIYNNGFGETWTQQVSDQARAGGQDWAADRIDRGDDVCESNQALRVHNPDLVDVIQSTPYEGELSMERSAETYAGDIAVPTFLGGAWQDEQTGGRFPALLDELQNAPVLRAVLYNGLHLDAISGAMLVRLISFLNLYVGDRPPEIDPVSRVLIGVGLGALFGAEVEVPPGPYDGLSVAEGRAAFEADPSIEILFEQGAEDPNLPVPGFVTSFAQWPPVDTDPTVFHFGSATDGGFTLVPDQPTDSTEASFTTTPTEGQVVTVESLSDIWSNDPGWVWPENAEGEAVTATTAPLDEDLVLVGNLSADLWVSLSDGASDADLEVTVSEIGPDGSETYVQAGWLRLSRRELAPDATELRPRISALEADVAPLVADEGPVAARVEVLPFAHVFRAGSRLRITIDTPGASRPQWRFDVLEQPVEVSIHSGPDTPSRVVVPAIPDLEVPTERPACGNLRGQPCRPPSG